MSNKQKFNQKLSTSLVIMLTPEQKEKMIEYAEAEYTAVSEWARKLLLQTIKYKG